MTVGVLAVIVALVVAGDRVLAYVDAEEGDGDA